DPAPHRAARRELQLASFTGRGAARGDRRARQPAGGAADLSRAAPCGPGHTRARAPQRHPRSGGELAPERGGGAERESRVRHSGVHEPVRFAARTRRPARPRHRQPGRGPAQARYDRDRPAGQHSSGRRDGRGAAKGEEHLPRRLRARPRDHARQGRGAASLRHVPSVAGRDQQRFGPRPGRDGAGCPPGRGEVSRSRERGRDHREARDGRGGAVTGRAVVAVVGLLVSTRPPVPLSAQAFPTTPPTPTPLKPVHFPPFKEATLPNGLQLVVIEHHEQPVISATLSFRAGGIYDPKGKEGLSDLAAELLSKGTDNRSAEQIAATIEGVGGTLSASSAEDFLTISAEALSDQAGLVFELLGDVTLHSTFPENEVVLARTRALSALALQLSQPGAVAQRFFESEIYGRNPYGRSATRESYRAATRDDVTQFPRQPLQPVGALLVVAGDVTDAQVQDLVARAVAGRR